MTRTMRLLPLLLGCSFPLGCGSVAIDDSTGSGGGGGDGGSGGAPTTSSTAPTTTTGPEPGTTTLKAEAALVTIPPGGEAVKCITVSLGNPEPVLVRKFRTSLNQGSHHMIVYSSDQPPDPNPVTCMSFGVQGGSAIFIAQQAKAELALPTDAATGLPVALPLNANQSVTIEIHYINATASPIDVIGTLELDVLPAGSQHIPSAFSFMGALGIPEIPPFSEADTGVLFQNAIAGTKVFALTTHQHKLGTRMRVWRAANVSDLSTPIADSTDWSDPPLELFDPPLDFPSNGSTGFAYQCQWKNPTAQPVYGGLNADDEMCFFWSYYYPAAGSF